MHTTWKISHSAGVSGADTEATEAHMSLWLQPSLLPHHTSHS